MIELVDLSYGRPGAAALVAAGKGGVIRYIPVPGDGGKGLTAAEVTDYRAAGLGIALVFESGTDRVLGAFGAGMIDARTSQRAAAALGFPDTTAIYFAVDFDATPSQQVVIDSYLMGCAQVIPASRVGVYGSYGVVTRCQASRSAAWFWQTYAWSGGKIAPGIHLLQYLNTQTINGAAVDYDRAYQADYGQWRPDEMQLDPSISTGMVADFSPGATTYRDAGRTIVFEASWAGGKTIGVVGVDAVNAAGFSSPNVCVNLYEPTPPNARALVYVGADHMVNLRPRVPVPPDQAAIEAANLAGKRSGYDLAVTGAKVTNSPTVTFPPRP